MESDLTQFTSSHAIKGKIFEMFLLGIISLSLHLLLPARAEVATALFSRVVMRGEDWEERTEERREVGAASLAECGLTCSRRLGQLCNSFHYDYQQARCTTAVVRIIISSQPQSWLCPLYQVDCVPTENTQDQDRTAVEVYLDSTLSACSVDGEWGDWTAWSSCSATCGGGTQRRERRCDSPEPAGEGQLCSEEEERSRQTRLCNSQPSCPPQAVLITGGRNQVKVEAFFPANLSVCSLPDLAFINRLASQDGAVMCGGENNSHSCYTFSEEGKWTKSHNLTTERVYHCSWKTEQGILLMGGNGTEQKTTELGADWSQSGITFWV